MEPFSIAAAAMGAGGGLASGIGNYAMSQKNLEFQKRHAHNMWARQDQAWAREDNAVQRRALDLQKAGLSKTLAAGSSAGSSAPIQIGVPKQEKSAGSIGEDVIRGALSMSQLSQTLAQTALTNAQTNSAAENARLIGKQIDLRSQELGYWGRHGRPPGNETNLDAIMRLAPLIMRKLGHYERKYNLTKRTKDWFEEKNSPEHAANVMRKKQGLPPLRGAHGSWDDNRSFLQKTLDKARQSTYVKQKRKKRKR